VFVPIRYEGQKIIMGKVILIEKNQVLFFDNLKKAKNQSLSIFFNCSISFSSLFVSVIFFIALLQSCKGKIEQKRYSLTDNRKLSPTNSTCDYCFCVDFLQFLNSYAFVFVKKFVQ